MLTHRPTEREERAQSVVWKKYRTKEVLTITSESRGEEQTNREELTLEIVKIQPFSSFALT